MQHIITIIMLCLTINIVAMDAMEIDSEEQYPLLFKQIINQEKRTVKTLRHDSNILLRGHDWGVQHTPDLLKKSYQTLIERYTLKLSHFNPKHLSDDKRNQIHDSFYPILDLYADIDHDYVIAQLKGQFRAHLHKIKFCGKRAADSFPVQLFSLLKKRDHVEFERTRDKMLEYLPVCLRLALPHQDEIAALQDDTFNLAHIVKEGFASKDDLEFLENIIEHENKEHSEFLEQEIVEAVPSIFKEHYIQTSTLKKLLESPSLKIRNSTLSALLSCIVNKKENWKQEDVINDIFEYETLLPLQGQELYTSLLTSLKQSTDYAKHYGTQRLIKRLSQDVITPFFVDVISDYFNVPKVNPDPHMIDKALAYALDHKTLSLAQLSNMLFTAKETGFVGFIDSNIMHQLKTQTLLNEDTPTKVRAQLLDELLVEHYITKKESSSILTKEINKLPYSPFKRYARALLIALDKTFHQTSYFAARAELLTLSKEYPDYFSAEPDILRAYGRLKCMIKEPIFYRKCHEEPKPNYIHLEVEQELKDIFFSEGPHCFGYVSSRSNDKKDTYQLHAYNKKTGIPVWISPMILNEKGAYTVGKDAVYCVTDNNNIAVIDLATGDQLQEISSSDSQLIINALHMCEPDTLCAVHDKHITRINVKTGDIEMISLSQKVRNLITIGNRLIIPTLEKLFILESNGTYKEIPHFTDNRFLNINAKSCVGTNEFIVYQKEDDDNKTQHVICLSTDTCNPLWELPLDHEIEHIQISPSDGTIFVLTKYALLALNPYADDEHRLLWQTKLTYNEGTEIDSIHLTQDDSTLYGIKKHSGRLYSFNVHTGEKKFLYEKHVGRSSVIVGDYDNKLYIQGINF